MYGCHREHSIASARSCVDVDAGPATDRRNGGGGLSTLEIRRHSWRKTGGGSQLSQHGVDLARVVGSQIGPFDRVVATVVPRARETAIAMGFAVDEELVTLSSEPEMYREAAQFRWWEAERPFASLAELIGRGGASSRYANSLAALWRDLLTPLEDGAVLVIGHSGELEHGLVACMPHADHGSWGQPFGPCEGARLSYAGSPGSFVDIEFMRVEPVEEETLRLLAREVTV